MNRRISLTIFTALFIAIPLIAEPAADARAERKQLVRELLKVIDSKHLTQSMLDLLFNRMLGASEALRAPDAPVTKEQAAKQQEIRKKAEEQMRVFRERLWARVDFATYDDQVYVPLFEKTYSADELRELIAFFKTKAGQKTAALFPDLSLGAFISGSELLSKEANAIATEMAAEEEAKKPEDERTMRDLRSVATAIEAYSTDENHYPKVMSYDALKPVLSPTYIRDLPEKDAWGTPYRYAVSNDGAHYRLVSAGADHQFEGGSDMIALFDEKNRPPAIHSASADRDIIYQDGAFMQLPAAAAAKMENQ
ncbi:MAG: Type secretion system protein [Thermoanaerobaculia bacterium]|jgi:hypothetical protein|nr:Type secretion system protein [Thermoanaerobaculia bacterium]